MLELMRGEDLSREKVVDYEKELMKKIYMKREEQLFSIAILLFQ